MRDAAVGALEHLGADRRVDQVVGARVRRGEQRQREQQARRAAICGSSDQQQAGERCPAIPSVSVIARVPIDGIRMKVVPSVPTMLPRVETP